MGKRGFLEYTPEGSFDFSHAIMGSQVQQATKAPLSRQSDSAGWIDQRLHRNRRSS